MISIPKDYHNNPFVDKKFKELIEFFNNVEKDLEYPNCENVADKKRVLNKAQDELIKWGVI